MKTFKASSFIMLYKVVLNFLSVDEILKCDIQMKSTAQYFPAMPFIVLHPFESGDSNRN